MSYYSSEMVMVENATEAMATVPRWKRILDTVCILLCAPGWVPLMVLISLYIKIVSPGPVFFRQQRVGYLGRRFTCLKFRSMKAGAETKTHKDYLNQLMSSDKPMVKMDSKGDPRVIPGGRLLRATGLDELPQLLNVLKGDMSIVGPRPCTPYEYEFYQPWQKQRFEGLPGLTGLWQVSGKNKTTFSEMINFDIFYIRNCSLWMDLKIMLKTFPVLFSQVQESSRKFIPRK